MKVKEGTRCIMELLNGDIVGGNNPDLWKDIPEGVDHILLWPAKSFHFQLNGTKNGSPVSRSYKGKIKVRSTEGNIGRMVGWGPMFGTALTIQAHNIHGAVQLKAECSFGIGHYGGKYSPFFQIVMSNVKHFEVHVVVPCNDNYNNLPPTNDYNNLVKDIQSVDNPLMIVD